jgi:protein ImuA
MASAARATARATLLSLRRQIASIEQTPPALAGEERGWADAQDAERAALLTTGAADFDRELGGGIALASLTEIHARTARDAGLATGFAAALLSLTDAPAFLARDPVLWIGAPGVFAEAGAPHGRGLSALGFAPERLLTVEPKRLVDALWVAEEAARTRGLAATILDMRGNIGGFGLRETQRLNRRAQTSGRPVLLLRQSAEAEASAAPLRLVVAPSPSAPLTVLAGTAHARAVPGGIGPPGFAVTIEKNKAGPAGRTHFIHWNSHERHFYTEQARRGGTRPAGNAAAGSGGTLVTFPRAVSGPAHPGAELSVSGDRPHRAGTHGQGLAAEEAS